MAGGGSRRSPRHHGELQSGEWRRLQATPRASMVTKVLRPFHPAGNRRGHAPPLPRDLRQQGRQARTAWLAHRRTPETVPEIVGAWFGRRFGVFTATIAGGTVLEIAGGSVGRITGDIASKFSGKSVARWFGGWFGGISCRLATADRLQDRGRGSDRQTAGRNDRMDQRGLRWPVSPVDCSGVPGLPQRMGVRLRH